MTATRRRPASLRAFPKLVAVMRELLGNALPVSINLKRRNGAATEELIGGVVRRLALEC